MCLRDDDNRQDESRHSKNIYSTKHLEPAFVIGAFGYLFLVSVFFCFLGFWECERECEIRWKDRECCLTHRVGKDFVRKYFSVDFFTLNLFLQMNATLGV